MAKPEWGTKRTGPCGTKFYDFNKSPIICPGCGGEVITHDVKTYNKNKVDKNPSNNSKEQSLVEDSSNNTELDSGILDDDIINDDVSLDGALDSEHEDDISDDQDINLINDDNNIVLDVEIDEDEK
tara:strand:+ start:439 stop:816 length:378 start_codon:yes stop_codon:yes gene_type:complete